MLVQLIYYTNNMSYLDTLKKYKLLNEEVDKTEDETVEEMSTSAGARAYDTPMAFGDVSDDTIEMMGYKKVKKVKKRQIKQVQSGGIRAEKEGGRRSKEGQRAVPPSEVTRVSRAKEARARINKAQDRIDKEAKIVGIKVAQRAGEGRIEAQDPRIAQEVLKGPKREEAEDLGVQGPQEGRIQGAGRASRRAISRALIRVILLIFALIEPCILKMIIRKCYNR